MSLALLPPSERRLAHIAERMNPLDAQEVWASGGFAPMAALEESVRCSYECRVVALNGDPIAAFGIAMHSADPEGLVGIPWLLATLELHKVGRPFFDLSRHFVDAWQARHPILMNFVDIRHHQAHRWLTWLGFEIADFEPNFGKNPMPFYLFKRCVNQ